MGKVFNHEFDVSQKSYSYLMHCLRKTGNSNNCCCNSKSMV